jgi:hypothetical protein
MRGGLMAISDRGLRNLSGGKLLCEDIAGGCIGEVISGVKTDFTSPASKQMQDLIGLYPQY